MLLISTAYSSTVLTTSIHYLQLVLGDVVVVIVWQSDLQQPIATKVVSLNPAHGEVHSIQYYVIKFVSDLQQVAFYPGTSVSSTNKADRQDITEILLKVALNTITLTLSHTHTVRKPKSRCFTRLMYMIVLPNIFTSDTICSHYISVRYLFSLMIVNIFIHGQY